MIKNKIKKIEIVPELNTSDNFDEKHNLIDLVKRINHIESLYETVGELKSNSELYAENFLKTLVLSKSEVLKYIPESEYDSYKVIPNLINLLEFTKNELCVNFDINSCTKSRIKQYEKDTKLFDAYFDEIAVAQALPPDKRAVRYRTDELINEKLAQVNKVIQSNNDKIKYIKHITSSLSNKLNHITSADEKIFIVDYKNKTIEICFYFANIELINLEYAQFSIANESKIYIGKRNYNRNDKYESKLLNGSNQSNFEIDVKKFRITIVDTIYETYYDEVPASGAILISGRYWNKTDTVERCKRYYLKHTFCLKTNKYLSNNFNEIKKEIDNTIHKNSRYR